MQDVRLDTNFIDYAILITYFVVVLGVGFAAKAAPWKAYLNAAAVGDALTLRPREPGETFRPQGLGGHRSRLNEFMINAKVPRAVRAGWPLLIGQGGIAWVCGLRVDDYAAVRDDTTDVWEVWFTERQI